MTPRKHQPTNVPDTIKTYIPTNVICIVGTIPLLDWVSLELITEDRNAFLQGKDGEFSRGKFRDGLECTVRLVVPKGSHYNTALTAQYYLDLPIPINIIDINRALPMIALSVTADTQAFVYPATFIKPPETVWTRDNTNVVWVLRGILRVTTQGGY